MFQRIYSFSPFTDPSAGVIHPRVYGRMEADATWSGWLVFFSGETAVAVLHVTTQASPGALAGWSVNVSPSHLGVMLTRALRADTMSLLRRELRQLERIERDGAQAVGSLTRDHPWAGDGQHSMLGPSVDGGQSRRMSEASQKVSGQRASKALMRARIRAIAKAMREDRLRFIHRGLSRTSNDDLRRPNDRPPPAAHSE